MQLLLDFVVKHDLKQQWMVKVLGFSTRDSTRSTTRAALRSPPRLFWRMLQHCYPCDCEGSAPTHPHTHPRTHVHARTHPSTHGHFFSLSLSFFSLRRSGGRGSGRERGADGSTDARPREEKPLRISVSNLPPHGLFSKLLLFWPFWVRAVGANAERSVGGGFVAPCATEKSRFFSPLKMRAEQNR